MRKILISILLTSAAASPALAQDQGGWRQGQPRADRSQSREDRQQSREEHQQAREERHQIREQVREQARSERSNGGGNVERAQQARAGRATPQVEAQPQAQQGQRENFDRSRIEGRNNGPRIVEAPSQDRGDRRNWNRNGTGDHSDLNRDRAQRAEGPSGWTRTQNGWKRSGDLRESDRPLPNVMRTRNPLIVSNTPREGTQPPLRAESHRRWSNNWNTSWRRDGRYDWRNWRDRHRSIFRVGIYYDPFGWSYRPYQIGWRLWPSYYGRRYWIDDPYQYRLPYAPPGTVWVRYWGDALLVDTWTGEVIDVIHNFFW